MYALEKFQPITLGITALQSGNSKNIHSCSKHWENKVQAITKTDVTYKWNVTLSCNYTIVFAMNRGIYYWAFFPLLHHV